MEGTFFSCSTDLRETTFKPPSIHYMLLWCLQPSIQMPIYLLGIVLEAIYSLLQQLGSPIQAKAFLLDRNCLCLGTFQWILRRDTEELTLYSLLLFILKLIETWGCFVTIFPQVLHKIKTKEEEGGDSFNGQLCLNREYVFLSCDVSFEFEPKTFV